MSKSRAESTMAIVLRRGSRVKRPIFSLAKVTATNLLAVVGGTVVFMTSLPVIGCLPSVRAQTITGTDFTLTGPQGNTTARLTTSSEGTPALFFFDTRNTVRVSIGLYADGAPGIVLNDDSGRATAILRLVQSNGNPVLVLKERGQDKLVIDKNGLPRQPSPIAPSLVVGFAAGSIGGLLAAAFARKMR